jgi:hypothetical protein
MKAVRQGRYYILPDTALHCTALHCTALHIAGHWGMTEPWVMFGDPGDPGEVFDQLCSSVQCSAVQCNAMFVEGRRKDPERPGSPGEHCKLCIVHLFTVHLCTALSAEYAALLLSCGRPGWPSVTLRTARDWEDHYQGY